MAEIKCTKCANIFDNNNAESLVTRSVAAGVGAAGGAAIGAEVGIAGGPFGAMNGLWVGAVFGAVTGYCAADQFRRCPKCGHIFKT